MAVNKDSTSYIIIFSVIISVICSFSLSAINSALSPAQDQNAENYIYFNVLKVFGLKVYENDAKTVKISAEKIQQLYKENIIEEVYDSKGNIVAKIKVKGQEVDASFVKMDKNMQKAKEYRPIFKLVENKGKENQKTLGYAVPVSGMGLWGLMWGFLSFKADCNTVSGITFYAHVETPGLGAEVEKQWFQDQFHNPAKPIYLRNEKGDLTDVLLIKGGVAAKYSDPANPMRKHSVDSISGATITSNGLNTFINKDLKVYEKLYFNKVYKTLSQPVTNK